MNVSINKQLTISSKLLQRSVSALPGKGYKNAFVITHVFVGNMLHSSYGLSGLHLDKLQSSNN